MSQLNTRVRGSMRSHMFQNKPDPHQCSSCVSRLRRRLSHMCEPHGRDPHCSHSGSCLTAKTQRSVAEVSRVPLSETPLMTVTGEPLQVAAGLGRRLLDRARPGAM